MDLDDVLRSFTIPKAQSKQAPPPPPHHATVRPAKRTVSAQPVDRTVKKAAIEKPRVEQVPVKRVNDGDVPRGAGPATLRVAQYVSKREEKKEHDSSAAMANFSYFDVLDRSKHTVPKAKPTTKSIKITSKSSAMDKLRAGHQLQRRMNMTVEQRQAQLDKIIQSKPKPVVPITIKPSREERKAAFERIWTNAYESQLRDIVKRHRNDMSADNLRRNYLEFEKGVLTNANPQRLDIEHLTNFLRGYFVKIIAQSNLQFITNQRKDDRRDTVMDMVKNRHKLSNADDRQVLDEVARDLERGDLELVDADDLVDDDDQPYISRGLSGLPPQRMPSRDVDDEQDIHAIIQSLFPRRHDGPVDDDNDDSLSDMEAGYDEEIQEEHRSRALGALADIKDIARNKR